MPTYSPPHIPGLVVNTGNVAINDNSADQDFRIESDNDTHVLFVEGSSDRVAVGTNTPQAKLHVLGTGTSDTTPIMMVESTDSGTATAPDLVLYRNSSSAADNDAIGHLLFRGKNDNASPQDVTYAQIYSKIEDMTDGTEDGQLYLRTIIDGTLRNRIECNGSEVVVNQGSIDSNFRVESDNNINMLFVDSANDEVGIGTNSPVATLDIASGSTFRNTRLLTVSSATNPLALTEAAHAGRYVIYSGSSGTLNLPSTSTAGEHYAILNITGGNITIGRNGRSINGASSDFTLATFKAATCIAIGSNNWMVVG